MWPAMDAATILREIEKLPVKEWLELIDAVWESIPEQLSPEQEAEIDRRIAHLDASPDDVVDWREAIDRIRKK